MITAEDLIAFGYWKKNYHETVKEVVDRNSFSKGDINGITKFCSETGEDPVVVRQQLIDHNKLIQKEAEEMAKAIVQMVVDSMNRCNLTMEQVKENYKA